MMRVRPFRQIAALSILCLAAMPVAAAPPRSPTAKWLLEFADHHCLASRDYGSNEDPLVLAFKPSPTGQSVQIIVLTTEQSFKEARDAPVTIQIDALPPIEANLLSFSGKTKGRRLIHVNLPIDVFEPLRQATSLSIVSKDDVDERFALGGMSKLIGGMTECVKNLADAWNIGELAQARLKTQAKAHIGPHLFSSDYPTLALMKDKSGTVAFVLLIDEKGKVADCMVTETSGVPALDAQTCTLLPERVRYKPAIGVDGKPAKDWDSGKIKWVAQ